MKVIDRKKEQELVEQAQSKERQQTKFRQELSRERVKGETISFMINRGTFGLFQRLQSSGALTRAYGNEIGGCFYLPEQIIAIHRLLEMSLRDRKQITELVVEEYSYHSQNVELILPSNSMPVDELNKEASKLGLDYLTYLRAIIYTQLLGIDRDQRELEKVTQEQHVDSMPRKFQGLIVKELRNKLEEKYGQQRIGGMFCTVAYGYGDMLMALAEEYFNAQEKQG